MTSLYLPHLGISLFDGMEVRITKYHRTRYFREIKITKCDKESDRYCKIVPCYGYRIEDPTGEVLYFCAENIIQRVEIINSPGGYINKVLEL